MWPEHRAPVGAGWQRVYVGLGANIDDPRRRIGNGIDGLQTLPSSQMVARSALYCSRPMGPADQPDYINAVAALDTGLQPLALLGHLLRIEAEQGRLRDGSRWGPRPLDLDLLVYGARRIDAPTLRIPHPGIADREFVLGPMCEIAPDLDIPGLGIVRELWSRIEDRSLQRLT